MSPPVSEVDVKLSNELGVLYIVATPIGNLNDIGQRATDILASVDLIAAEDTRHSGRLLQSLAINTPMIALHEHNEKKVMSSLLARLEGGESIALISDAGTPLISDPGFSIVREARRRQLNVVPIPGPSAVITALSAAGLATDRFLFEGFPPRSGAARRSHFQGLLKQTATLIFYESSHRLADSLGDMVEVFGPARRAVLARELTKLHETFIDAPLAELHARVLEDENQQRGEMVVLLEGAGEEIIEPGADIDLDQMMKLLLAELPVKRVAAVVSALTGLHRNDLYKRALAIKDSAQ
jgi:16S rRNA (cytidine1402-2'-O)-methyltransferase